VIIEVIQVCWSLADTITSGRELDGLKDAMRCYNLKEGTIITEDEVDVLFEDDFKIHVMPTWKWLIGYTS